MTVVNAILGALIGASLGSFASATAWRLPRHISLWTPSRCDSCGKPISPWRNLPIITWCLQRGKGACCGERIPVSVVVVEAAGAAIGLLCGLLGGMMAIAIFGCLVFLASLAAWFYFKRRPLPEED